MKKLKKKNLHRILAMVLVLSMLGANMTTLSFATEDEPAPQENSCTLQEHVHSDACKTKTLICELPDHEHVGTCYEYPEKAVCGLEESEEHTHSETCMKQVADLICQKHVHSDACYQLSEEPTCGLQEHTHSEECEPEENGEEEEAPEQKETCEYCGAELTEEPEHADDCLSRCTCQTETGAHGEGCPLQNHCTLESVYGVTVSGDLPEGAELSVQVLSEVDLQDFTLSELENIVFALDVSILVGGMEYQPTSDVTVTVKLPANYRELCGVSRASELLGVLSLYHLHELGIEAVAFSADDETDTLTFIVGGFSAFIGTIQTTAGVFMTPGRGYSFYDGSAALSGYVSYKSGLTITVKPDDGYALESVAVTTETGVAAPEATVKENQNGTYVITFTASPAENLLIAVQTVKTVETGEVIYFDLSAGNIEISGKSYTGYRYDGGETATKITGTLAAGQSYYVYQSNGDKQTGFLHGDEEVTLPQHERVIYNGQSWGDFITNNTDVVGVIKAWNSLNRPATGNWISVEGSVDATIVIDSLWSNKQIAGTNIKEGGIAFNPSGSTSSLEIFFKGDNRFGNILYRSSSSAYKLCLDGDSDATLTVADKDTTGNYNYWNAAIGSTDSFNDSRGIVINGGIVYAGTTVANDCTAIGAGGNGYGVVTINDGIVTAVCSSSGTAIGGGIGKTAQGGAAEVTINGGTVYAYNFSCSSRGFSNCSVKYIPAAAIGGGSSAQATCYSSTVRITGGTVYAQSVGGTAIGGGSSADNNGGDAIIEISGGTVYAKSISGVIDGQTVPAGAAIGGGTGGDGKKAASVGKGGNATVTIVGGTVVTGSIGGGSTINPNATAGYANVRIDGGTVSGQVIMGEVGDGKTSCTFNMTGGSLSKSPDGYVYKYEDGGAVYMDDPIGVATVSGGIISGCTAVKGGAVYMKAGTFEVSGTGVIQDCAASDNGGAVYMTAGTFKVSGSGVIQNCTSGANGGAVYMTDGTFEMSEAGAIQNCTATTNGGAVYLQGGTVNITGGSIASNNATNGAGAYMAGGTMNISGTSEITANIASANGGGAYLADGTLSVIGGSIAGNNASNGAGVYMGGGTMTVSGSAGITGNTATANGGGAYLADGTLSITGGSIAGNNASNGAGVYMGGGEMTVSGSAGITGNTATANGGGAYLANGTLNVAGGQLSSNTAAGNGGGAFLSGGKLELSGGELMGNTALSGGGAYLQNGNVTMSGGTVSENKATAGDGGGMYVSAEGQDVNVLIYSGSFEKNEAANAGGALAVCGNASGEEQIKVVIGLHEIHAYTNGTLNPIEHDSYCHESCPVISENVSYQKGGAILVSGGINTNLSIYCLDEANNRVGDGKDQPSNFMMVEGGKVVVSTAKTMGEGDSDEDDNQYGETEIENSVHVVGGQVDLYGATSNPNFGDAVTVDIPKNDTTSHFEDHRYSDDYYTILYFENFKDPLTDNVSGQYKSYQIPKNDTHIIKGVIYAHPGYEIKGWYTNKDGSNPNTDHSPAGSAEGKYEVGHEYTFNGNPIGDLIIYAQWDATGYFVRFNSNVPPGETYSGKMVDLDIQYGVKKNLTPNAFKYPGHRFVKWKDENGTSYDDGQEVENLANEKNAVVMLYAQWKVCDHATDDCTYTYTKLSDTQMKRECSCGGQTIFVSIYAQSVTYDGQMHPVQLIHTHPASWEFVETYTKDEVPFVGTPKDAGVYTYTVWAPVVSDPDGMSLSVTYTIEKANQPNPPAPTHTVVDNTMTVLAVEDSTAVTVYHDPQVKTQYRLVYYDGSDEAKKTDWKEAEDGVVTFELKNSYTDYYVEAQYTEGLNHKESGTTRSAHHFHIGEADILVLVENGMSEPILTEAAGTGGAKITVGALPGHYLSVDIQATSDKDTTIVRQSANSETATFLLSGIPNEDVTITVTITGVGSELSVQSAVTETEVFTAVSGASASITQESAFTAYYRITNYSASVYSNLSLSFESPIPKGTTILLMDKSEAKTTWWSYTATGSVSSVPLELFTRMGSNDPFVVKNGVLQYQFIVDFAEAASSPGAGSMNMTLKATKGDANAKELNQKVNVALTQKQSFTASAGSDGMIATVSLVVNSPQDSKSTKWDGSRLALVLTPPDNIPPDARLQVEGSTRLVVVHRNADGNYVIPCGVVTRDVVMFRLISDLLPASQATYKFTAKWVASRSLSASAIANGTELARTFVSIAKPAETRPSLEITGRKRLFNVGDTMTVNLKYIMEGNCEISAQLQRLNENGGYSNTGLDLKVGNPGTLNVSLAGQNPGDFRLYVEIRRDQQVLAQMSYYFILQS